MTPPTKNATILALVLLVLAVHLIVGVLVGTRRTNLPLLPVLNLAIALCVIGYWIPRWYASAVNGIIWYASDQLVPLYAVLVCLLSGVALQGRYRGSALHWIVFGVDAAVLLVAAWFFMTFSMKRLI